MGVPTISESRRNELTLASTRLSNEHDRLNALYTKLLQDIDRGTAYAAQTSFARLRSTLDGHFAVEDRVHFPTVEKFRPGYASLLATLTRDHGEFRDDLELIGRLLDSNELCESRQQLKGFANRLLLHECAEETLLADLGLGSEASET